jgi:hypothetical protein
MHNYGQVYLNYFSNTMLTRTPRPATEFPSSQTHDFTHYFEDL